MQPRDQNTIFDHQLIRRFDVSGPRYTSYPTADRFHERFTAPSWGASLSARGVEDVSQGLSLYFHIPFCDTVCYYCACNKVITKDRLRAGRYLDYLEKEMALVDDLLKGPRLVSQMHWGGGTPTFLSDGEIARLCNAIRRHFEFAPEGEYSIEVDPRRVSAQTVVLLAAQGFNRMSVGVQDFHPEVQRAVNRIQSVEETFSVISAARANGFKSVSIDLIYGLPLQNLKTVAGTLERVLEVQPDRLALYNYAHLPTRFMPQRRIKVDELPSPQEKLDILDMAIARLTEAGYVFIGMDHFARPDDELAVAQREGRLYRNFQGYSTHSECDLLAFGASAIGKVGGVYAQNEKTLEAYYDSLDQGALPIVRGYAMNDDDKLRYAVIQALMCDFSLTYRNFEISHGIRFAEYFANELALLASYAEAGLCTLDTQSLQVTPQGRMLVRVLAMVFDRYLQEARTSASYSRVI